MPSKFLGSDTLDAITSFFHKKTPEEHAAAHLKDVVTYFKTLESLSDGALQVVTEPEKNPTRVSLKTPEAEAFPMAEMRQRYGDETPPETQMSFTVVAEHDRGQTHFKAVAHDHNNMKSRATLDHDIYERQPEFDARVRMGADVIVALETYVAPFAQRVLSQDDFAKVFPDDVVPEIRQSFAKPLGGIIADVLGEERVKELFDAQDIEQQQESAKPVGQVALEMGVISADTKTALLIAQAAERTYELAEKAEHLVENKKHLYDNKVTVCMKDLVEYSDPVFKYVGSENDPEALQQAQGTWMAAQLFLNNELQAVNGPIAHPAMQGQAWSIGKEAATGFKAAAQELYQKAAEILGAENHTDAAQTLQTVAEGLRVDKGAPAQDPATSMSQLASNYAKGSQDLYIVMSDPRYLERAPIEDVYDRLAKITKSPTQANESAKPSPVVQKPSAHKV